MSVRTEAAEPRLHAAVTALIGDDTCTAVQLLNHDPDLPALCFVALEGAADMFRMLCEATGREPATAWAEVCLNRAADT